MVFPGFFIMERRLSSLYMTEYVILPLLQAGIARLVSEWRRTALP